eukprot:s1968_g12.t1
MVCSARTQMPCRKPFMPLFGPNAVETLLEEINAHAIAGDAAAAAARFHAQAPMPAPRVLWNTVMKAYANAGDLPGAEQWLKDIVL